jgi:hypothetical protein
VYKVSNDEVRLAACRYHYPTSFQPRLAIGVINMLQPNAKLPRREGKSRHRSRIIAIQQVHLLRTHR